MALPILTVVGALGNQGRGLVNAVLSEDPPKYQIRALTSNPSSSSALELAKRPNVTVKQVDVNSQKSLEAAFEGSTAIFGNTMMNAQMAMDQIAMSQGLQGVFDLEGKQGLNIVRAAAKVGSLQHLIYSTLPDTRTATNGKHDIPHFQSKVLAEEYIRDPSNGLSDKSTYLRVGMYGSNILRPPYTIQTADDGRQFVKLPCSPTSRMPFIADESFNTGIFAKAALEQPEKTKGRYIDASAEYITCPEWYSVYGAAIKAKQGLSDKIDFEECSLDEFTATFGEMGTEIGVMMKYWSEYGERSYRVATGDAGAAVTAQDLGILDRLVSTKEYLLKADHEQIK